MWFVNFLECDKGRDPVFWLSHSCRLSLPTLGWVVSGSSILFLFVTAFGVTYSQKELWFGLDALVRFASVHSRFETAK